MAMKYELTKDLETGNALIDSEHRQLFAAINNLMHAPKAKGGIKSCPPPAFSPIM